MSMKGSLIVFGEVLHDCFPGGENVLGGAPFNVAWHLQALGDAPCFVSRVGDDERGNAILEAIRDWGMDTTWVQSDPLHGTGRVDVVMVDGEPEYSIAPDAAYDFIDEQALTGLPDEGILYHGSLALRHAVSRSALDSLARNENRPIFLDVNLRAPWWEASEVHGWLSRARWAKMNQVELAALGFDTGDVRGDMTALQERYPVEKLVVTRGRQGVLVRARDGAFYEAEARELERRVDPVGAGDAFSALFLHGIASGWPLPQTLARARDFAERIIGIRGATPEDVSFYRDFI